MHKKTIETNITIYNFEELSLEDQNILNKSKEEVHKSYAPYSGFHVGAAIALENGEIVTGNNQENAAYPSGLCAERVAMFYANSQYPNTAPTTLAIAAFTNNDFLTEPITPCGGCRQVLLETEMRYKKNIRILLYGTQHVYLIESSKQLLPLSFEKENLQG